MDRLVEYPDENDYAGYDDFDAAMLAYARNARDEGRAYLLTWNPWQIFGSRLQRLYPTARTPEQNWPGTLSEMRVRIAREVFGEAWAKEHVGPSWTAFSKSPAVVASLGVPPPPGGQRNFNSRPGHRVY